MNPPPSQISASGNAISDFLTELRRDQLLSWALTKIRPGTFARDPEDEDYRARLIYADRLRLFVYNPGVMNTVLTTVDLKESFFRTFGYAGNLDFTIYPNAWLRDLPLVTIGKRAYLGDHILLGTNSVSIDQQYVRVGEIKIGEGVVMDQQCAIGLGTSIGNFSHFAFRTAVGLKSRIGEHVHVGVGTMIGNKVTIGDGVKMGQMCVAHDFVLIESGAHVADSVHIPSHHRFCTDGRIVPRGSRE